MSISKALEALGFVQADPIRAPARAQDLTLRHRVTNYRAGDLERRYSHLDVHEDSFINYGFVTDRVFRLMHPRRGQAPWSVTRGRHVKGLLELLVERADPSAGRDALPRPAARGSPRRRHQNLRAARARSRPIARTRAPPPPRRAGRCGRERLRAAAGREPGVCGPAAAIRG